MFALFEPPGDFFEPRSDYKVHRIKEHEVGFLDKLAVQYYGSNNEELWWVIALANAIVDPEREMYPGMTLAIPPQAAVVQFLARIGNAVT